MKKTFLISVISAISIICGYGQDIHFSQFSQTPLLNNPALTGFFNGENRAFINYKDQWRSIGAPYKTYALSYDMPLFKKKWDKSYLGAGVFAFNDKAGDTQLGTTQLNISFSGVVSLNENHSASAGIQGGFLQRSIDASSFKWGNQFDNGVYDPSLVSGETKNYEPSLFGDFSAGFAWGYSKVNTNITSNDQFMANAGIALFHINQPKIEFSSGGGDAKLYAKLVLHGNAYWGFKGTNIALLPSFLFVKQGSAQELNIGTMVRYQLKEGSKYTGNVKGVAVSFGGYYRTGDAFIPAFMLEVANFALGVSYDVNVSGLTNASKGKGGMEISLRFINPNPFQNRYLRTPLL